MSTSIDEQTILGSLRRVPEERWGEVLQFLDSLSAGEPAIRTGEDLSRSGLVGAWADRQDLGNRHDFARQLRRQAETRQGEADPAGL